MFSSFRIAFYLIYPAASFQPQRVFDSFLHFGYFAMGEGLTADCISSFMNAYSFLVVNSDYLPPHAAKLMYVWMCTSTTNKDTSRNHWFELADAEFSRDFHINVNFRPFISLCFTYLTASLFVTNPALDKGEPIIHFKPLTRVQKKVNTQPHSRKQVSIRMSSNFTTLNLKIFQKIPPKFIVLNKTVCYFFVITD